MLCCNSLAFSVLCFPGFPDCAGLQVGGGSQLSAVGKKSAYPEGIINLPVSSVLFYYLEGKSIFDPNNILLTFLVKVMKSWDILTTQVPFLYS